MLERSRSGRNEKRVRMLERSEERTQRKARAHARANRRTTERSVVKRESGRKRWTGSKARPRDRGPVSLEATSSIGSSRGARVGSSTTSRQISRIPPAARGLQVVEGTCSTRLASPTRRERDFIFHLAQRGHQGQPDGAAQVHPSETSSRPKNVLERCASSVRDIAFASTGCLR